MSMKPFPKCQVLCVYHPSEERLREKLMGWLQVRGEERTLVILGAQPRGWEGMRVLGCEVGQEEEIAKEVMFLSIGYYSYLNQEEEAKAFARFSYLIEKQQLRVADFQDRGVTKLSHLLSNRRFASQSVEGSDLFGKFQGVPALICGAGPSLEREAAGVRALQERALLFAGGTALSSLTLLGLSPHFAGAIDPNPPQKRHALHQAHHCPIFYPYRTHPHHLKGWKGTGLWMPGAMHDLFEHRCFFDGGWNVSTFLTAIACEMGCNPIILVGVDLAQSKEKSYSLGLPRTEGGELVKVPGTNLYSRTDWLFARDWLADYARARPHVQWIQGSTGGLDIAGFERKSLSQIELPKQEALSQQVAEAIRKCPPKRADEYTQEELKASYRQVAALSHQLLELSSRLFPHPPHQKGEYVLLQVELEAEVVYRHHLLPMWNMWKPLMARQVPKEAPAGYGLELHRLLFMKEISDAAAAL